MQHAFDPRQTQTTNTMVKINRHFSIGIAVSLPQLKNDVFLRSLLREPVPYTPIWLMRQAGRYLPEYNATRAQAGSFMQLAQNPEFACEVTLQPLRRFDLDAAILFSDILTVPHAMGLGLDFVAGEGPRFARPVRNEADVMALEAPDMSKLQYVFDAVSLIRKELDGKVPLIGFAGSPWTIAVEAPDRDRRAPHSILTLQDAAVATSGDYRHWVTVQGRHLSHTMDPARGAPLLAPPASVTVIAPTCAMADAWATALMVLGADRGARRARQTGLDALFLCRDDAGDVQRLAVGDIFSDGSVATAPAHGD